MLSNVRRRRRKRNDCHHVSLYSCPHFINQTSFKMTFSKQKVHYTVQRPEFLQNENFKINIIIFQYYLNFLKFWWQQLAAGRSLNCASCRGGWGERSSLRSATTNHSIVVDRTPNLRIERRTLYHSAIAAPSWKQRLKNAAVHLIFCSTKNAFVVPWKFVFYAKVKVLSLTVKLCFVLLSRLYIFKYG